MTNKANFPPNVHYLTTPRYTDGGNSRDEYANFNLASYVGDDKNTVIDNQALLVKKYQLPNNPKWLTQTHSNICLLADNIANKPCADASWSATKNTVCTALTADCLPIFISNKIGNKVGIIHAGYQGLLNGVIENFLTTTDITNNDILVHFGAGISQEFLALDDNIYQQFIAKNLEFKHCFKIITDNYYLDMYKLARIIFAKYDIFNITGGNQCTYSDDDKYFSYRKQGAKSGRMANLIWFG